MRKFRDIDQVRQDLKATMPLNDVIEIIDGKRLEMVNDHLYKKKCDLDDHPMDKDGTRDSTPSFTVCPQKELWYCFGCNMGGDRFEYVSRKLHVDHMEAIFKVAEIEGVDLNKYYEDQSPDEMIKDSLFLENRTARQLAHKTLLQNETALKYLLGRGMSMESIEEFEIGYAPPIDDDRVTLFNSIPNSVSLHLDRKDQFNDAILFPVCDPYGRMRYFQSRPFHPYTGMKYIGGSDTHPLFDDNDRIFGLSVAKKKLRDSKGRLVGVEGAPDAIICNQHGIPAIGTLGTAVSQILFDILDRYRVTEFVLVFDGDKAGWNASMQVANKYLTFNTKVRLKIVMMEDGDPDEFINSFGPVEFKKLLDNAPLAVEHLINAEYGNINPDSPTKKIEFMTSVERYVNSVQDAVTKKILVKYIAEKIGFDPVEIDDYYLKSAVQTNTVSLFVPDEEEVLLAEAIRNPDFAVDLLAEFDTDDWYLTRHKELFNMLRTAKYHDIDSLHATAKNMKVDNLITYGWLQSLQANRGNVEFCLSDVQDKLIRRKAKEKLTKLDNQLMDMSIQPNIIIDRGLGDIYNVTSKKKDDQITDAKQQVNSVMNLIHQRMKNPGQIIGYDLGPNFKKLTRALLGLQTKTLTIIAANQSVGKTQLGENWALHMACEDNVGILWFTLEMDKDRMTFRNLSILSSIPLTPLLTGNITVEEKISKLDPMAVKLEGAPFYLSERGHELYESLSIARKYVMKGVKVIFIDYLQLQYIENSRKERYQELGMISKAWKQFAKEMDVAVVALSQLSKQALQEDIAKAEHGSGSYEVAQDADNYFTLKEKSQEEIEQRGIEHGNLTGNLDKNRMGTADILIDIYSDRDRQQMKEVYGI